MNNLTIINEIKAKIEDESKKENPNVNLIKEMTRDLMILSIGLDNLNINGNFKLIP